MKKTVKKVLASLLAAVMVLAAAPMSGFVGLKLNLDWLDFSQKASALEASGSCGENVTYTFDEGTGLLTISGSGDMDDYSWYGSPFYNNSSIKSVIINNGVTSIGSDAFYFCSGLTSITIPDSVTEIGSDAFSGCTGLTDITIPNSVTYIGSAAFYGCTGLTDITLSDSLGSINSNTFYNCTGLKGITIPDSVTSIGYYAFQFCRGLTSITIPGSVTTIREGIFYGCEGLTDVIFSDGAASISIEMFSNCTGLKNVTIPDSVTSIGDYAFEGCEGLTEITIPDSVTSIGEGAFYFCTNLTDIFYTETQEEWNAVSLGDNCIPNTAAVRFCKGQCGYYVYWTFDVSTGLLTVSGTGPMKNYSSGNSPLYNNSAIKSVVIKNGVTSIGNYVFEGCTGMTGITIPDSVTDINSGAFKNCTGLENISVSDNNYVYDSRENCNAIIDTETNTLILGCKNTVIPDDVTRIGDYAFEDCTGLTEITIPDNVTSIGNRAFNGCTGLTEITIPDSVTVIGSWAFENCTGLTSVTIPDSFTSIGSWTFNNCTGLKELTMPCSAEYNNEHAFSGCSSIEKVTLTKGTGVMPNYSTYLSDDTLYYEITPWYISGDSIKEIVIEDGVTNIGDYAFYECRGLTSVTIPDSVTSIGNNAFARCTGLASVAIPDSVTRIGDYAFYNCSNLQNIIFESDDNIEMGNAVFEGSYNVVICCKENSYMHYYSERKGLQYCILDDDNNPNFSIENDILVSYDGSTENIFLSCASKIGFGAFSGNETVKFVELASNVTRIYNQAFKNCTSLEKIIIPKNVSSIGDNAFTGCDNLTVWCYAGSYAEAFAVNHDIPVRYITLTLSDDAIILADSETASLTASFSTDMLDEDKIIWTSSDPSVAVVNNGTVTMLDVGEAEIVATTASGLSASCTVVTDLKLSSDADAEIDRENGFVTGTDFVNKNVSGIEELFINKNIEITSSNNKVGTGNTVTLLKSNGKAYRTVQIIVFGDVNGDGIYDGMDAMIVSCLANGMLSESDVSEAEYIAADCNHDGVIDSLDVEILNRAGVLLADVDQSKSEEELLETSSAYIEYLNLIDQTVEAETAEAADDEPVDPDFTFSFFDMIIGLIKEIAAVIKSVIAFFK